MNRFQEEHCRFLRDFTRYMWNLSWYTCLYKLRFRAQYYPSPASWGPWCQNGCHCIVWGQGWCYRSLGFPYPMLSAFGPDPSFRSLPSLELVQNWGDSKLGGLAGVSAAISCTFPEPSYPLFSLPWKACSPTGINTHHQTVVLSFWHCPFHWHCVAPLATKCHKHFCNGCCWGSALTAAAGWA